MHMGRDACGGGGVHTDRIVSGSSRGVRADRTVALQQALFRVMALRGRPRRAHRSDAHPAAVWNVEGPL